MSRRPNRTRLHSAVSDDVLRSQTSALDAYVAAKWLPLAAYQGCPAPEGPGAPLQTAFERDVVLIPGGRCSDGKAVKGGACEPTYTPVRKSHGLRSGVDQGSARPSPAASVASSLPCSPPASWESLPPMAALMVAVPPPPSPRAVPPRPLEPVVVAVPSDSAAAKPAAVPRLLLGLEPAPAAAAPSLPKQPAETATTVVQPGRWTSGCVFAVLALALALLASLYHTAGMAARGHWHVASTALALLMDTATAGWAVLQLPCFFRKGACYNHTGSSSSGGGDSRGMGSGTCCPPRTTANCETWSLTCWVALSAAVRCALAWNTYMHTARPAM